MKAYDIFVYNGEFELLDSATVECEPSELLQELHYYAEVNAEYEDMDASEWREIVIDTDEPSVCWYDEFNELMLSVYAYASEEAIAGA